MDDYSSMVLIIKKNFGLFTTIGHILGSSMLVKVELILGINYAVVVGIHHLEQVLRLSVCDLQTSDLLNCLLELPLKNVKIQKRNDNFQNEHLLDPLIEDVIFQVINIGEEVFECFEAVGTAGVHFKFPEFFYGQLNNQTSIKLSPVVHGEAGKDSCHDESHAPKGDQESWR